MIGSLPDIGGLPGPIALVAHDAGAANLLLGWLEDADCSRVRAHLAGPALAIWRSRFPNMRIWTLEEAMAGARSLISGTGWSSQLEHDARELARAAGIRSIAAVDHWVNYRARFERHGNLCLPDTVWVGDRWALAAAQAQLPEVRAEQYSNRYVDQIVERVRAHDAQGVREGGSRVLYALEPIRLVWATDDTRPGEFQALDYFLANRALLGLTDDAEIRLRPHPSDMLGKYDDWIAAQSVNVRLAPDEPIENALAWSTMVAGCESFVLLLGIPAGRKVVSTLPPWGNPLRLPQPEIIRLMELAP